MGSLFCSIYVCLYASNSFSYCTFVFKSESQIPPALLFFKVNLTAHGTLEILYILGSFFLFLQKMKLGC